MWIGDKAFVRAIVASERGSVAIQIGLLLVVLIGMVSLGTEITFLVYKHRQMQAAADSAALGGATALATGYPADFALEARAVAAAVGYVHGVDNVTVAVNRPPTLGPRAGDTGAVEVIVSQPQTLSMVTLFREGLFNVGARAVAAVGGGGNFCVLQTVADSATGVTIDRGANVTLDQCGVAANSTGTPSLSVTGGSTLNTQSVHASGTVETSGGGVINSTEPIKINQAGVSDPYAAVVQPSFSGCGGGTNRTYGHGTWSLNPGVYCGNLKFTSDAIVTMKPGSYVIAAQGVNNRTLTFEGNARVSGTDVTIFLGRRSGAYYANVVATNSARVTLSAPTTGALAGLVFFGDRNAPLSTTNRFEGDARLSVSGAIYFPSQTVQIGNSSRNQSDCTQLIAGAIRITATTAWRFNNDCANFGTSPISGGGSNTALVE